MRARAAALWLVLAVIWFGTLGIRPLYKADESRYGEISREMVASGDWVTPRLNGFKYFEKPPLQYWASAALFELLGEHDWVARLWTALIGFAGIGMVLYAGNRLFGPPIGGYAAAVLATSPLYILLGQVNTLDMSVSFFLSAAIFAFALGHMLVFWAACALAVLSKGLIGIVLPGGALFFYMLAKRDWGLIRRLRIPTGLTLFLVICAPWFIAVSAANREFAHFFFVQEHFERFTTQMHHRVHPAWYFIAVLAAGMAPWLVPLGDAAVRAFRRRTDTELLLWIWALVVFVFFSVSSSKLPPYILPIFPALAVLAARSLTRSVLIAQSLISIPIAVGAGLAVHSLGANGRYESYAFWILIATLVLAAAAAAALVLAWRFRMTPAVFALGFGSLLAMQIGIAGHRTLSERFSVAATVAQLPERPAANAPVFAVDMYDHTLPWTLKRTVTMVGYRDELGDAVDWEKDKFVPDHMTFARLWNAAPQAWAFLPADEADRLPRELGIPAQVMARGAQYAILKKP
ncbi:MAG TPA: glycosyltransferase family 39 protein [Burkholderiales bacterium]|nr:glycosyltransferase family 39 protein [Burkholderiales bacterium]